MMSNPLPWFVSHEPIIEYIHLNPLAEHWNLVANPCDYYYSSALFYEKGISHFPLRKDLRKEF